MTKQEYNKYIQSFNERGYKFVEGQCSNEGYYYKVIESRKDIGSDSRVDCLLVFNFYDLADSCDGGVHQSIEPSVMVTSNTGERLDLTISHPKYSIEEYERIVKEFMNFVDIHINIK